MIIYKKFVCTLLLCVMILIPFGACSSKSNTSKGQLSVKDSQPHNSSDTNNKNSSASGSDSSSDTIIGKVTSIVGNEVTLAIGTLSNGSSSELALTGESQTLLIPVGLTLSGSGQENSAGTSGAPAGEAPSGNPPSGGTSAGSGQNQGTTENKSAKASTSSKSNSSAKSTTSAKSSTKSGFSSITAGEILRISQKNVNGTLTVVKVAIVSK